VKLWDVAEVDGRWRYTFSGAGEVFSVVRPEMVKNSIDDIHLFYGNVLRFLHQF